MSAASERITATLNGLTALAESVSDPIAKAAVEGLVQDWTVAALILEAQEKNLDKE